MQKHVWEGVSTLVGTVVGAGILAMPFVIQKSGFWTGMIMIVVLGLAVLLLNLMLGEIILRSNGNHQLSGYAEKYLGKWGKWWMSFSMLAGIYGALLAYMIGEGHSLSQLFGGSPALWSWIFYAVMAVLVYAGLRTIEKSESVLTPLKIVLFLGIFVVVLFSGRISTSNLVGLSWKTVLVPYGVILFSCIGTAAIPEVREETRGKWKDLQKILVIGSLIPLIVYALFALIVIGVTGSGTTELATIGLGTVFGTWAVLGMNFFAVLAMMTSFMALGLALKEMFMYDYKMPAELSWFVTMIIPALAVLAGLHSFSVVIGITGAIAGGVDGVLIVWMHARAQKHGERKPEYSLRIPVWLRGFLVAVFVIGIIHVAWY